MSSIFSVSKFLSKSRGKSGRRDTATVPSRTGSLMSVIDKEKDRKPSVPPPIPPPPPATVAVAVIAEQPPPTNLDTSKAGPSTELEPVSEKHAPPLAFTNPIPISPETRIQEQTTFVEEPEPVFEPIPEPIPEPAPEPVLLPLPQSEFPVAAPNSVERVESLEEPGYAVVLQPEAKVSETEWSALGKQQRGQGAEC
ncbi:hypothetical protein CPB84DRAFT_909175 [Gymnopilus junonius]|uniref:Uncharacterized protein n=1 Tax=Gymnopilus junonius TaxID=109634 RepID=A0A9P5NRW3_GYMJU|nr:hypothetical protein CPB84DRAFT_909175 [Gymnopilus junonius]